MFVLVSQLWAVLWDNEGVVACAPRALCVQGSTARSSYSVAQEGAQLLSGGEAVHALRVPERLASGWSPDQHPCIPPWGPQPLTASCGDIWRFHLRA